MALTNDTEFRGIFFSAVALILMLAAIAAAIRGFDTGFFKESWRIIMRPDATLVLRSLGIATILIFSTVIALLLQRGIKMWSAETWKSRSRTISGLELKFESAVVSGLGVTVLVFATRGIF